MLRTTVLDDKLNENQCNEDFVLTSLLRAYERHFPAHSQQLKHIHDTQKEYQNSNNKAGTRSPRTSEDETDSDEPQIEGSLRQSAAGTSNSIIDSTICPDLTHQST